MSANEKRPPGSNRTGAGGIIEGAHLDSGKSTTATPWMRWCPRDYRASTQGWPPAADLAYRCLLDASWDMDGLPDDANMLRQIARCAASQWKAVWALVGGKFPLADDGRLRNPRQERERVEALRLREARVRGAEAAHRARREREVQQ